MYRSMGVSTTVIEANPKTNKPIAGYTGFTVVFFMLIAGNFCLCAMGYKAWRIWSSPEPRDRRKEEAEAADTVYSNAVFEVDGDAHAEAAAEEGQGRGGSSDGEGTTEKAKGRASSRALGSASSLEPRAVVKDELEDGRFRRAPLAPVSVLSGGGGGGSSHRCDAGPSARLHRCEWRCEVWLWSGR
jgi:hypothetical protein